MPLYEPPAGADPTQLVEDLADQIRDAYEDVETRVLVEVKRLDSKGKFSGDTATRAAALQELQAHVQAIVTQGIPADWAAQVIAIAQTQGTAAAAATLRLAKHLPAARKISTTMQTAVAMLQADLTSRMDMVEQRILRYPVDQLGNWLQQGDVYQRTIAKTAAGPLLNQQTKYQAQKLAMSRFLEQGVTGFTDKADRRWSLGAYSEMATRSAVQRAYTDSSIARMQQSGINLVQIIIGTTACKHCGQWAGKILSTDGTTGTVELPSATTGEPVTVHVDGTIEQARSSGWQHPNCRCQAVAYLPGITNTSNLTRYDPEKEHARDQQRYLERRVREFKRKAQLADDPAEARKWAARARGEQGRIRDLLEDKPYLVRKYKREQVRWATGRGGTPPTIKTPPAPSSTPNVPTVKWRDGADGRRIPVLHEHRVATRGNDTATIYEVDKQYADQMAKDLKLVHDRSPEGKQVTVFTAAELRQFDRLYTTIDGQAGGGVRASGEIGAVYSKDGPRRSAEKLVKQGLSDGGYYLECFDTYLPEIYGHAGMEPVAAIPFNRDFAPEGWDYHAMDRWKHGEPDILFMISGDGTTKVRRFDDYDEAESYARRLAQQRRQDPSR